MADNRRTLNLGLIGCRWITETLHLPALQNLSDVKVVAVADTDPDRLKQVADRFQIQHRYTDYMALLDDPVIEAVGAWVPPHCQVKVAQAVLSAGKHLFIEKPSVLDLHACDELSKQAAQSGRTIMVGFPRRWHRLVRRAREIIAEWQHFVDCICRDTRPECTMEDGRRALQIVLVAKESAALGRPVKIARISHDRL